MRPYSCTITLEGHYAEIQVSSHPDGKTIAVVTPHDSLDLTPAEAENLARSIREAIKPRRLP